jgi:hypothetical protein
MDCIEQCGSANPITMFHLPWTKIGGFAGKNVFWAAQRGVTNLDAALTQHLKVNAPLPGTALFTYWARARRKALTYNWFWAKLYKLCTALNVLRHC